MGGGKGYYLIFKLFLIDLYVDCIARPFINTSSSAKYPNCIPSRGSQPHYSWRNL